MAPATDIESKTSAGVRELALSYLGQGKTDTAERLLRELLALKPDDVQGLRLLALILQSQVRSDEAVATLQKAVSLAPQAAHVHADLAALYRSLSRPQDAARAMRQALELEPSMSAGWWLLGDVMVDGGDVTEATRAYAQAARTDRFREAIATAGEHLARQEPQAAERIFRDVLRQEGKHIAALCGLSAVALLAGQPAQAERMLKVAQRQSPHSPMVWRGMAQTLMEAGRFEEAEAAIRRALRVDPEQPRNWVMLGTILARRFRPEEALDAYDHALALNPAQRARVQMSRGHLLKTLGRRAECEAAYLACVEEEPANGEYYWCLADLKTYRFDGAQIARMQAALDDSRASSAPKSGPANQALLHFALGRAYEQRAQYAESFQHYAQANAERRRGVVFDAATFEAKCRRIAAFFTAERLRSLSESGEGRLGEARQDAARPGEERPDAARPDAGRPDVARPIFIVGLPRSGSTLVEQILASHSQVEGTMELPHIINLVRELDHQGRGDAYPESVAQLDAERLQALGRRYLKETMNFRSGRACFIDKMPNNFRHLGFMRLILPQAVFVDVRRHPMDACFSAFKQYFAEGQTFSYDLEDLGRYYRAYLELMTHWQAVMPGQVLTVQYESLVRDTDTEVRRLLDFCGLEFEPACLRFHETQRPVRTASAEQVRRPIYDSGIGHWRHFETQLAPLRRALGDAFDEAERRQG